MMTACAAAYWATVFLYCNGNRETGRYKDCEWSIEVNPELINVYFTAYRAGNVSVKLDLGKWYIFKGKHDSSKIRIKFEEIYV